MSFMCCIVGLYKSQKLLRVTGLIRVLEQRRNWWQIHELRQGLLCQGLKGTARAISAYLEVAFR